MRPSVLAKRVRERREQLGLTQAELANQVSEIRGNRVSQQSINDLEHEHIKRRPSFIAPLAAVLKTNPDWLLGTGSTPERAADFVRLYSSQKTTGKAIRGGCCYIGSYSLVKRPDVLQSPEAWMLELSSECMMPLYDPGDVILCEPAYDVRTDQDYVFLPSAAPQTGALITVARLVRRTRKQWTVKFFGKRNRKRIISRLELPQAFEVVGAFHGPLPTNPTTPTEANMAS